MKKKIHEYDFGYTVLFVLMRFIFHKYFRQIEVRGLENIPENEPVLLAPNHQQGLLDPLAILFNQKKQIVFLARADIFSNPFVNSLLRFLKIAPIYRIRDGYENLSKNDEQMKLAVDVLCSSKTLCLMPEGNHGKNHRLRHFVKGLFRIAFTAEEQLAGSAHVKIVPVNIDYNHYEHAGSDLVVCFSPAIEVRDYLPIYQEHPATGLKVIRDVVHDAVSQGMVDIRSEHYEAVHRLTCFGTGAYLDHALERGYTFDAKTMAGLRFDARRALGHFFDELDAIRPELVEDLDASCKRLEVLGNNPDESSEMLESRLGAFTMGLTLISTLLMAPGFLLNAPVWILIRKLNQKIADPQMRSSFSYALGAVFNSVFYLLVALILSAFIGVTLWQGILLYVAVALLGVFSESARQSLRIPWRMMWFSFGKRKVVMNQCRDEYGKLRTRIRSLLDEQSPRPVKDATE